MGFFANNFAIFKTMVLLFVFFYDLAICIICTWFLNELRREVMLSWVRPLYLIIDHD